jgi:futalosine hydrolase
VKPSRQCLLVCATPGEAFCLGAGTPAAFGFYENYLEESADLLVTGPGTVATAFEMARILERKNYEAAINFGIAGAYHADLAPGEVVEVVEDEFADLGADDRGVHLSIFEMGLVDPDSHPFSAGKVYPFGSLPVTGLKKVKGATVNTVSGETAAIEKLLKRTNAEIESMEGAAFFFACARMQVPSMAIRSISNRVEPRDKSKWQMKGAMDGLENFLRGYLPLITSAY